MRVCFVGYLWSDWVFTGVALERSSTTMVRIKKYLETLYLYECRSQLQKPTHRRSQQQLIVSEAFCRNLLCCLPTIRTSAWSVADWKCADNRPSGSENWYKWLTDIWSLVIAQNDHTRQCHYCRNLAIYHHICTVVPGNISSKSYLTCK